MLHLIQGIPIILAFMAIVVSGFRLRFEKRNDFRLVMVLCLVDAALLLLAQTSWWQSHWKGSLVGEAWANEIWTVYNGLTMIIFVIVGLPRKLTNKSKP